MKMRHLWSLLIALSLPCAAYAAASDVHLICRPVILGSDIGYQCDGGLQLGTPPAEACGATADRANAYQQQVLKMRLTLCPTLPPTDVTKFTPACVAEWVKHTEQDRLERAKALVKASGG